MAKKRIPVVLTQLEVQTLLARMGEGVTGLLARLLYGTGMRLLEGIRLRVKDVDFVRQVIVVRDGKGGKDRVVMLPRALEGPLRAQLLHARRLWRLDQHHDRAGVYLPHALAAKYKRAAESWTWFWVFPADAISSDPRSDALHRHHIHEKRLQRDLKAAVDAVGIAKPATVHTLRHSFATPPAPGRHRHPHRAVAARPCRRQHDHDLHPRAEVGRSRHGEPARRLDDGDGRPRAASPTPRPRALSVLPSYAELHCRSNFSFLTGASHPEEAGESARPRSATARSPSPTSARSPEWYARTSRPRRGRCT